MNKSHVAKQNQNSADSHDVLQKSETLNRKYVSRPKITIEVEETEAEVVEAEEVVEDKARKIVENMAEEIEALETEKAEEGSEADEEAPDDVPVEDRAAAEVKIEKFGEPEPEETAPAPDMEALPMERKDVAEAFSAPEEATPEADEPVAPPETHPYQRIMDDVSPVKIEEDIPAPSPRELKNEAIRKALNNLQEQQEESAIAEIAEEEEKPETVGLSEEFKRERRKASAGKFFLAFATSAVCVGILGYFISVNMPNISVRVAAMQSGIDATYPGYIPRDYQLDSVTSNEDGKITIVFSAEEGKFTLAEEKSSWDSNALLNNYVKDAWGEDYSTLREQGITIYISDRGAAWVNGGVLYKLSVSEGKLTKKQIKNIATSL